MMVSGFSRKKTIVFGWIWDDVARQSTSGSIQNLEILCQEHVFYVTHETCYPHWLMFIHAPYTHPLTMSVLKKSRYKNVINTEK